MCRGCCVAPFANPATESVFQGLHVLHEVVEAIAKLLADSPSFDVWVQGSAATGFHFPADRKESTVGTEDNDGGRDAVRAPFLWNSESFGTSGLRDTVWTHAEHKQVEEPDEELEHDRLPDGVVHETQTHFHIRRDVSRLSIQIYGHALDEKQRDISRVGQIGRRENERRAP